MRNRVFEFSVTYCFSCPIVLRIIVSHNLEDEKAFLLYLAMNVIKFITLEIVPGAKSSPQSVMSNKSLEWSLDQDGTVHH